MSTNNPATTNDTKDLVPITPDVNLINTANYMEMDQKPFQEYPYSSYSSLPNTADFTRANISYFYPPHFPSPQPSSSAACATSSYNHHHHHHHHHHRSFVYHILETKFYNIATNNLKNQNHMLIFISSLLISSLIAQYKFKKYPGSFFQRGKTNEKISS